MGNLIIKEKEDSPYIEIYNDKGEFLFSGNSYPEDAMAFYAPIKKWVKEYVLNPQEITFIRFKFNYLNTASIKSIMELLMYFLPIIDNGNKLVIEWYYKVSDEDIKGVGKKFMALSNIPFVFKIY